MDTQSRKRQGTRLLTVALGALIIAGCLPAPGADNAFYVLLPYAVAVVASGMALVAHAGLTFKREVPGEHDEAKLRERTERRALAGALAAALAAVGEALHALFVSSASFGYALETTSANPIAARVAQLAYCTLAIVAALSLLRVSGHKLSHRHKNPEP